MLDIFTLLRNWFNWCFENPEKINPNHTALYVFCIEHCNRLGWKEKFGLPTTMAKEAIGIKSYNTYKKTLDELVQFGFIKMVEMSKNQYSSNIIALSKFDKALDKALDKASSKHLIKHSESTRQSNDSIDIHNTKYIVQTTIDETKVSVLFENNFTENFIPVWSKWIKYKNEQHKFKYKNFESEKMAVAELFKLSNGNEILAEQIINQSMVNSWKGLFKIKNDINAGHKNNHKNNHRNNATNNSSFGQF